MYARLCLRLSKEAPNFESPSEPCTFRLLLLNKCRDEFENRSKANDAFDLHYGPLGPEDEERRQNAKRKMLGNIKFIGELGKLEILGESILHRCIHQLLLEKNKKETGRESNDMTEDLELLCQIMRTCGRNLDIKGEKLMDQYFQRMSLHAENTKLPIRIRFMLRDVIELRMCRWVPREATSTEGPQPLHQIQPRDIRESSKNSHAMPNFLPKNDAMPNNRYNRPIRGGLDYNMGNYKNNMQKDNLRNGDYYGQRHQEQNYNPNKQQNFHRNAGQQSLNMNTNYNDHEFNNANSTLKNDLPPHFTEKIKLVHQQSQLSLEALSLRPAPESMMFGRANSKQHGATGIQANSRNHMSKPISSISPPLQKDLLPIKQALLEKNKVVKKEKPLTKEPTLESLMEEYNTNGKLQDSEQKVPDKLIRSLLQAVMIQAVNKTDTDHNNVCNLISQLLKKPSAVNSTHYLDAFRSVLSQVDGNEDEITRINSNLSRYTLHAISDGIVTLAKLSEVTENGALFLLILQDLHKTQGEAKVIELFNECKVNLLKQMPEIDRSKENLLKMLEERNLGFLLPLLGIQSELWKQLQVDPNPTVFYKWVKENVDIVHHSNPEFVNSLMTVIVKYIVMESGRDLEQDAIVEKPDKERVLLEKFKPVLQVFIHDHVNLQVTALYALQTFCHSLEFPKGLLLRWFVNLYELEIVEEEAFLKWKENVTDEYPGKGKALFQVNSWLVWLEMTESEGEDDEDE